MIKEAVLQVHWAAYGGIADYILQTTSSLLAAADCSFAKQLLEGRGRDLGQGPGSALAAGCQPTAACHQLLLSSGDRGVSVGAVF